MGLRCSTRRPHVRKLKRKKKNFYWTYAMSEFMYFVRFSILWKCHTLAGVPFDSRRASYMRERPTSHRSIVSCMCHVKMYTIHLYFSLATFSLLVLIHEFSSSQKHSRAVALALIFSVPNRTVCVRACASALIAIYVPWITKSYQFLKIFV